MVLVGKACRDAVLAEIVGRQRIGEFRRGVIDRLQPEDCLVDDIQAVVRIGEGAGDAGDLECLRILGVGPDALGQRDRAEYSRPGEAEVESAGGCLHRKRCRKDQRCRSSEFIAQHDLSPP